MTDPKKRSSLGGLVTDGGSAKPPSESLRRSASLRVVIDGVALPPDDARVLWERFSDWMEDHRGDLAGFATAEGFASVHPGVENGRPVLLVSRRDAQRPYAPAAQVGSTGGSVSRHEKRSADRPGPRNSKK